MQTAPSPEAFSAQIDELVERSIEEVAEVLGRELKPIERKLATAAFWARTGPLEGDWVAVEFGPDGARIVLEQSFRRAFIALAVRLCGAPAVRCATGFVMG